NAVNAAFRNQPNQLTVNKSYATYGTTSGKESTKIAAFTLVNAADASRTIALTANGDGTVYTATRIPDGTWKLMETAPTGYDRYYEVDPIEITVTDGKISYDTAAA